MSVIKRRGHASKFYAYRNVVQIIPSGAAWNLVQGNIERYDTLGEYDNATFRFVPHINGYYCIIAQAYFVVLPIGTITNLAIYRTGGEVQSISMVHDGVFPYPMNLTYLADLTPTDRIELFVRQNSGVNQNLAASFNLTYLSGFRVY